MPAAKSSQPTLIPSSERAFDRPNAPNAAILMSSLRHLGYSNHSAIADLIDNSIDADADAIVVQIDRDEGDFVISVIDNGTGMNDSILDEATRLGSDTDRNVASDLGLYGMGLVTASISIGRRLQVLTKSEDGPTLIAVNDLDEIVRRNEFVKYQAEADPDDVDAFAAAFKKDGLDNATGSIVTISKADGMQYSSTGHFVNSLKKHLAQTFRHYIAAGKTIMVNSEKLEPIDPLHLDLEGTTVFSDDVHEFRVKAEDGSEIIEKFRLKIAVLPDFGEAGNRERGFDLRHQGFYILRNNREIAERETLGLFTRHSEFNLFRAELSVPATLDDVLGVNFTKREVKPNQAFVDKLRAVAGGQLKTIRAQRWAKRKKVSDENGGLHDEAARLITAKQHLLVKPKAEIEKRRGPGTEGEERKNSNTATARERKNLSRTRLTADDLRCKFETVSLGEGGQIFEAFQEGRTIIVRWNIDHPFYQVFVGADADDDVVTAVDFFVWAWASAELMVYEDGKVAEMLDTLKSLISMNTRTLLK